MGKQVYASGEWRVLQIKTGKYRANSYIILSGKKTILIDPGNNFLSLISALSPNLLFFDSIYATHGHFDHIGAILDVKNAALCEKMILHVNEEELLKKASSYSILLEQKIIANIPISMIHFVTENRGLLDDLGFNYVLEGIHTSGSIFIYNKSAKFLFTGDSNLFMKINKNEIPKQKLLAFNIFESEIENLAIFPGHGRTWIL